jgi:hypothetical protein
MIINQTTEFGYSYENSAIDRPEDTPVASIFNTVNNQYYYFPFNINSLNWAYNINTQSFDTYGGRVTQILSAMATTMSLQGEAGTRKKLLDLYGAFKGIQNDQNSSKQSMQLNVPSRGLSYRVFLEQMSIAWDVTTVTYPYQMSFEIQQDLSTTKVPVQAAVSTALDRIADGIGYSPQWNGMNKQEINLQYQDVKNFANLLQTYGVTIS